MTTPLFIDPIATGDATLLLRARELDAETTALVEHGDADAIARGEKIASDTTATVTAVASAYKNKSAPSGLTAWRDAYGKFYGAKIDYSRIQQLPTVTTEAKKPCGFFIPGTQVFVPCYAALAVVAFLGVAWYVINQRGKRA